MSHNFNILVLSCNSFSYFNIADLKSSFYSPLPVNKSPRLELHSIKYLLQHVCKNVCYVCTKLQENWKFNVQVFYTILALPLEKKLNEIYDQGTETANKNSASLEYLQVWFYA